MPSTTTHAPQPAPDLKPTPRRHARSRLLTARLRLAAWHTIRLL